MLAVTLPIVPFYILPKKKWEHDQERKERIEFDSDEDDENDDDDNKPNTNNTNRINNVDLESLDSLDNDTLKSNEFSDKTNINKNQSDKDEDANFGFSTKGPQIETKMVHYNINSIGNGKDSPRPGGEHIEVPIELAEMFEDPKSEKPIEFLKIGPFYYIYRHIKAWAIRVKKRRMHYMIKHYYLKIMKHNEAIKVKQEEEVLRKEV